MPVPTMMHDFLVTKRHVLFLVCPATFRLENIEKTGSPIGWEPGLGTQIGVMPRDGGSRDVRWFQTEASYVFHALNAYEDGERIVADVCRYARLPLFEAGEAVEGQEQLSARLTRWTLDLAGGSVKEERLDDLASEFPRFDERRAGLPYRHGYAAAILPGAEPLAGFDAIVHWDLATGRRREHRLARERRGRRADLRAAPRRCSGGRRLPARGGLPRRRAPQRRARARCPERRCGSRSRWSSCRTGSRSASTATGAPGSSGAARALAEHVPLRAPEPVVDPAVSRGRARGRRPGAPAPARLRHARDVLRELRPGHVRERAAAARGDVRPRQGAARPVRRRDAARRAAGVLPAAARRPHRTPAAAAALDRRDERRLAGDGAGADAAPVRAGPDRDAHLHRLGGADLVRRHRRGVSRRRTAAGASACSAASARSATARARSSTASSISCRSAGARSTRSA